MKWTDSSPQAKAFAVTFAAATVIEFIGETTLYGLIPGTAARSLKIRFWSQYVASLSVYMVIGLVGHAAVDCLAKSGWAKTAWLASIFPAVVVLSGGFVLHGVDTILGISSGTGSMGLLKAAFKAKKANKPKA